jgi:peptidyl-prolyl cis-trans isomerase D
VTNIERAHDRPLAEVKEDVVKAWTDDQRSLAVAKKASELVKSLEGGTPIADIASANKLEVVSVDAVTRASNPPGLSPASVNAIFAVKADGAGYALGGDGLSRIVFKVKSATLPPAGPAEAEGLAPRLKIAIEDDIMQAYVRKLEQELGLTVDEATLRAALRGSEEQQ